jgi:hypothetical protein
MESKNGVRWEQILCEWHCSQWNEELNEWVSTTCTLHFSNHICLSLFLPVACPDFIKHLNQAFLFVPMRFSILELSLVTVSASLSLLFSLAEANSSTRLCKLGVNL